MVTSDSWRMDGVLALLDLICCETMSLGMQALVRLQPTQKLRRGGAGARQPRRPPRQLRLFGSPFQLFGLLLHAVDSPRLDVQKVGTELRASGGCPKSWTGQDWAMLCADPPCCSLIPARNGSQAAPLPFRCSRGQRPRPAQRRGQPARGNRQAFEKV